MNTLRISCFLAGLLTAAAVGAEDPDQVIRDRQQAAQEMAERQRLLQSGEQQPGNMYEQPTPRIAGDDHAMSQETLDQALNENNRASQKLYDETKKLAEELER